MSESPKGVLVRSLLEDGAVRLLAVEATGPAEHTRRVHDLGPGASRIGAETLVATALTSAHIKGEERLTLQIQASQPRCSVFADVTAAGAVRARVTPADLDPSASRIDGVLVAIKSLGTRELYRGATAIDCKTVEEALQDHLHTSDQREAVIRIGVWQGSDGAIVRAGGVLMERLPEEVGQPSIDAATFADRARGIAEADLADLLTEVAMGSIRGRPLQVLQSRPLRWRCSCSRDRVATTLAGLGVDTLRTLIEEDGGAEVICDLCLTPRHFDPTALRGLLARLSGQ